jgi:cytochrome c55X
MRWRITPQLQNKIVPVVVLAAAAICAPASGSPREDELKRLVRQDCGSCHGMTLKGGLGKPLLPETLAPLDVQSTAQIILGGIPGTPMPPWQGILSENDALWIAMKLKEGFPQ